MKSETLEQGWDEHFAYNMSYDDRSKASKLGSRNGRASSPTHSAHGNLLRHSLMRITDDKRAKKVRFYRNGDKFFKGMVYAVSPERFRTFESLMANLTDSPVGDKAVLPHGVRHIFTLDGSRKITELEEMEEGESYVCASTDVFRRTDYDKNPSPSWNKNQQTARSHEGTSGTSDTLSSAHSRDNETDIMDDRFFIKPKLVTIVRNGSKPRKAVRVLLNRKTAHSFDQVLNDITDAIKLNSGAVKRIYTLDGRPVTNLGDFFKDETIFVAYGPERFCNDDLNLDDNASTKKSEEVKLVSPYKPRTNLDRVTLRSTKAGRKLSSSTKSLNDESYLSPRSSPKLHKRIVSAPKYRTFNGENGEQYMEGPPSLAQRFTIGKMIGEGNFAIVKECIDRLTKKRYALKIIEKEKCRGKEQMIQNEVAILRKVKHTNIIELKEEFDSHTELYLVMELVKGGDLFDAIAMATKYTEKDACAMIQNLASALDYLHGLNIVHRDIKPENLLVCDHGDGSKSLKLGDFGLATYTDQPLYTVCGTPTYVAPEILAETGYGAKVDVWASGVIMYILLCGFPPFVSATNTQEELFDQILECRYEFISPYWDEVSDTAKDLIKNMLTLDPDKRYSAARIQRHHWVTAEAASENNIHTTVTKELKSHFNRKPRPSLSSAGIRLIAATALDKDSRFFEGRKPQLTVASELGKEDEIF